MCKLHDALVNNCGIKDAHTSELRDAVNEHSEEREQKMANNYYLTTNGFL